MSMFGSRAHLHNLRGFTFRSPPSLHPTHHLPANGYGDHFFHGAARHFVLAHRLRSQLL